MRGAWSVVCLRHAAKEVKRWTTKAWAVVCANVWYGLVTRLVPDPPSELGKGPSPTGLAASRTRWGTRGKGRQHTPTERMRNLRDPPESGS